MSCLAKVDYLSSNPELAACLFVGSIPGHVTVIIVLP